MVLDKSLASRLAAHTSWRHSPKINLKIDNVFLQKVNCAKYLGIFIDSNLS